MAVKTAIELKAYFETGDVPTQAQFVDLIDTIFSAVPTYKIYRAILNQSGTNAPVATILENTLNGTLVWTRDNVGVFSATLNNAFINDVFISATCSGFNNDSFCTGSKNDNNTLQFINYYVSAVDNVAQSDGYSISIEIIVNN